MKKVVVSGAAGFIGNAVAKQLLCRGIEVTAIVKPQAMEGEEAFRLKNLSCPIIECDIREMNKLLDLISDRNFDTFYQFAWDGTDNQAMLNYDRQIDNIKWTMNSIWIAAKLGCTKYIGAGSITQRELLDRKGRFYTADRHKYYRAAQMSSEIMGRALAKDMGIEFLWPIIINVYGEGEINQRLVNTMIKNLLAEKQLAFSAGEQLYDFLHVEDAACAFYLLGNSGRDNEEYVIGSGSPRALKEYLKIIRDITAPQMELRLGELEFTGLEMTEEMLNIDSLKKDTGFEPQISFEKGIERTLNWVKENNREE